MKILVVSTKAGFGHLKAAQAIEEEIISSHRRIEVKNVDLLDYSTFVTKEIYSRLYIDMVHNIPRFYGWLYDNLKSGTKDIRVIFDRINTQKFQNMVFNYDPDIVVCTQFIPANILTFWRQKYKRKYKVAIIMTDYEAHPLWVDNQADLYFVANQDVKSQMIEYGLSPEKINITGIPISNKFSRRLVKKKLRKQLGISGQFTVLVLSGGAGVGPIEEVVDQLCRMSNKINILVVAGKNEDIYDIACEKSNRCKSFLKVYKFVENVEELMFASDLIIGKSGGLVVSESLAVGTPLIIINPIPGQEEANANFLTRNLAAISAQNTSQIKNIVSNIIIREDLLSQLKQNAKKLSKPQAAKDIINIIIKKYS